ncbi:GMC family oxidoreductase [uncultured Corynebacterium sp.]|uniref:GMC family oxidoreductase n=1 Tax=uncultured Corynebacterium sp. TaxID=159447 RepID=UPI00288C33A8|nr:GMC family oxidoreductase [uncultured Corynebacterium sp.]
MMNNPGDHSTGTAPGRAPQNPSAGPQGTAGTATAATTTVAGATPATADRIDPTAAAQETYDVIIIGAGTSGLNIARELAAAGLTVLGLEAGKRYDRHTYPRTEIDSSSQLFWGGGVELTTDAGLGLLRPKVVGGGSIVNQALMDRFDDVAFSSWRDQSGVSWLNEDHLADYYDRAEGNMSLKNVPEEWRNGNAKNFADGFDANGYRYAPLRRGEADCRFEDGNCCVECLSGCGIDSKQSTAITALPAAEKHGFHLIDCAEARTITEHPDRVTVTTRVPADPTPKGRRGFGKPTNFEPQVERTFTARRVVLASGAIGNTALLLRSGYGKQLPGLGKNFFTHPQYMNLGRYAEDVRAFAGPLQNYKSDDPSFRRQGFKLENVFAGPGNIALLLPGFGARHAEIMQDFPRLGCIEVCVRDTNPGEISINRKGNPVIKKKLNREDARRRDAGMAAIRNIFNATGAEEILHGQFGIGLHLMGGLGMGASAKQGVVSPEFTLYGSNRIHAADSSIFPNAPGINPALTIAALSLKAAEQIIAAS